MSMIRVFPDNAQTGQVDFSAKISCPVTRRNIKGRPFGSRVLSVRLEPLQARKSLRLCLAGLRIRWFDPIAKASELPDHSCRALSELIGLNCQDVVLGTGAHVRCLGKGRKQRCTPLRPETTKMLEAWLRERHGLPEDPVFPSVVSHK
jgi:integrase